MGAVVAYRCFLPAVGAFTMRTEIPILLPVCVALTTYTPGFVETNLTIPFCIQEVAIFIIVTGQAPKTILTVIQTDAMHRGEFVGHWVCLPVSMALGTGKEGKIVLAVRHLGWRPASEA